MVIFLQFRKRQLQQMGDQVVIGSGQLIENLAAFPKAENCGQVTSIQLILKARLRLQLSNAKQNEGKPKLDPASKMDVSTCSPELRLNLIYLGTPPHFGNLHRNTTISS